MRLVRRASLALSVAFITVTAAQALEDVPGWQNTRWGMTEAEVRKAVASLGMRVVPVKRIDVPFKARIPQDGQEFEVTFHFLDDPRRLDRVLLRSGDLSRPRAQALHATLLRSLSDAHGQPTDTVARGTTASMTRWRLKSTTIALSIYTDTAVAARHPTVVSVMYGSALTPPDGGDQKALALGLLRMLGQTWSPR